MYIYIYILFFNQKDTWVLAHFLSFTYHISVFCRGEKSQELGSGEVVSLGKPFVVLLPLQSRSVCVICQEWPRESRITLSGKYQ